MHYREQITQLVAEVVRKKMSKPQAVDYIQGFASQQIQAQDRERFIEAVENQLLSLHEGNIARYRLRSSELIGWRENWHRPEITPLISYHSPLSVNRELFG